MDYTAHTQGKQKTGQPQPNSPSEMPSPCACWYPNQSRSTATRICRMPIWRCSKAAFRRCKEQCLESDVRL
ncbi:hypothetical protein LINPERHAP1_LOCUS8392 [Linum perenne]